MHSMALSNVSDTRRRDEGVFFFSNSLFVSGEKLSVPCGFIGGAMFWIDGIVNCGYPCCPWMSDGKPVCIAGDDEADAIFGPIDDREDDFCLVSCGGC